jgi:U3 small nucleolar RNA-associated protein 21
MEQKALFVPYKAVGHVTDGTPFAVNRLGNDIFLTFSIGSSFQVMRADHLTVCMVSRPLDGTIAALQVSRHETFVAVGKEIVVYKRNRVVRTYREHEANVVGLFLVGTAMLSWDSGNTVNIIDVKERAVLGCLQVLQPASISCVMHPATYLNKVVIGFANGVLELWNIRSRRLVHTFSPLAAGAAAGAGVLCVEQSPACDVVAVGFSSGDILLLNLKLDKVLFSFTQKGAVTSLSFRTDAPAYTGVSPYLVSASSLGEMHVWRLGGREGDGSDPRSARGLVCSVQDAHSAAVSRVHFLEGEPVLVTSAADNSVKMWIFDQPEGHAPRLLRSREGHTAPPERIRYYGTGGHGSTDASLRDAADAHSCEIVSCGAGGDIRVMNTARESQSREMSQKTMLKKLGLDRRRSLLPPAIDVDFSEAREKDWGNMVSIHRNHSSAYTWKYRSRAVTEFVLRQPAWKTNDLMYPDDPARHASALAVSACGHFCVVGNKGGSIHRYNLQSGLPRGSYPAAAASQGMKSAVQKKRLATPGNVLHASRSIMGPADETSATGYLAASLRQKQAQAGGAEAAATVGESESSHLGSSVTGIFIDAMNETMVSASNDSAGLLLFWDFDSYAVLDSVSVGSPIYLLTGYRDGGFVAVASEDGAVRVFDVQTRRLSRVFRRGHSKPLSAAVFSPDGRRLLTSSLDGTVRVWDMLTARCLAWVSLGLPVTSMALSPSGEFMSVTLEGKQGVYLYADRSLFETVHFWREPTAPTSVALSAAAADAGPGARADADSDDSEAEPEGEAEESGEGEEGDAAAAPESRAQRGAGCITFSAIPRAYWTTLFNMEAIKARNKPAAPPTAPVQAPFFLPTIHREGSAAPSFLTPKEYSKVAKAGTDTAPGEGEAAGGGKKRKLEEVAGGAEERPEDVAAAIASMGSAWADGDDDAAFGAPGADDWGDAGSDGDDWGGDAEAPAPSAGGGSSRILKSSKDMPRELAASSRYSAVGCDVMECNVILTDWLAG